MKNTIVKIQYKTYSENVIVNSEKAEKQLFFLSQTDSDFVSFETVEQGDYVLGNILTRKEKNAIKKIEEIADDFKKQDLWFIENPVWYETDLERWDYEQKEKDFEKLRKKIEVYEAKLKDISKENYDEYLLFTLYEGCLEYSQWK